MPRVLCNETSFLFGLGFPGWCRGYCVMRIKNTRKYDKIEDDFIIFPGIIVISGRPGAMNKSTTKQLAEILAKIDSPREMEQYMEIPGVKGNFRNFAEYFRSLPAVHSMDSAELIQRSGLERSYFYQVMKGTRNPGQDKVLRLCLGAGLSLKETTRALELSGNAVLYPRKRRDIILTVAINQKAGVDEANLLLFKYGEEPLE